VLAFLGKREGVAKKVDSAAVEAEGLGLTRATLIGRMARLEIDRAEPDKVESMPRNNSANKQNWPPRFAEFSTILSHRLRPPGMRDKIRCTQSEHQRLVDANETVGAAFSRGLPQWGSG
jgi:hypothetical protein